MMTMKDVWNELLEFESRDLIASFFKRKHNSEVNDWKVQEVAANFIQGREYFRSAQKASITVKPLLLYYGVVSLSRGLVLVLNPKLKESNLKASHGLSIRNWPEVLSKKRFEDLEIVIGEGSFSELLSATENKSYLRVGTNGINWAVALNSPPKGYAILLKDIFQFLPDLKDEFTTWLDIPFPSLQVAHNGQQLEQGRFKVMLESVGLSQDLVSRCFPSSFCHDLSIKHGSYWEISFDYTSEKWSPNFTQKWSGPFDIGTLFVTPVLKDDAALNLVTSMFAISYSFGMMARYYPSTWISLGRVQKGDKIFPLVNRTLKLIEERYPATVLDFLRAPYNL